MKKHLTLLSAGTCGFILHSVMAAPLPSKLPAWVLPKAMSSKLGAPQLLNMGKVRPPKDYQLQRNNTEGVQGYAWVGEPYEDSSRPYFMVMELTVPAKEAGKYTDTQVLGRMLEGIEKRRTNWSRTPAERGTINGQIFVRARWSGKDSTSGQKMKGFAYVAKIGRNFIQLSSQQPELHQKQALDLAEAAAWTFVRKPG